MPKPEGPEPYEATSIHEPDRPDTEDEIPILSSSDIQDLRSRWEKIQTGFVDEPRRAVEEADELVAEVMQRLAQGFSELRRGLEAQWEHSKEVSTEDLRLAVRRYRFFLDRLLSVTEGPAASRT